MQWIGGMGTELKESGYIPHKFSIEMIPRHDCARVRCGVSGLRFFFSFLRDAFSCVTPPSQFPTMPIPTIPFRLTYLFHQFPLRVHTRVPRVHDLRCMHMFPVYGGCH